MRAKQKHDPKGPASSTVSQPFSQVQSSYPPKLLPAAVQTARGAEKAYKRLVRSAASGEASLRAFRVDDSDSTVVSFGDWHPRGDVFATATGTLIRVWQWTGSATTLLHEQGDIYTDFVSCVAWSPNGQWLATATADNGVRIWHWPPGGFGASGDKDSGPTQGASGSGQRDGSRVNLEPALREVAFDVHGNREDTLSRVIWHPGSDHLIGIGVRYMTLWRWDEYASELQQLQVVDADPTDFTVFGPTWHPSGRWLATGGSMGDVVLWGCAEAAPTAGGDEAGELRPLTLKELLRTEQSDSSVTGVSWSPDGEWLAITCENEIVVCALVTDDSGGDAAGDGGAGEGGESIATLKKVARTDSGNLAGSEVAWHPSGLWLATVGLNKGVIAVWAWANPELALVHSEAKEDGDRELFVCWSPNGTWLLTGGWSCGVSLTLWDGAWVRFARPAAILRGPNMIMSSRVVAWHPSGKWLASCGEERLTLAAVEIDRDGATVDPRGPAPRVRVREVAAYPNEDGTFGITGGATAMAWDPAGGLLAVGSQWGGLSLLRFDRQRPALRKVMSDIDAEELPVNSVSWAADGKTLTSCGQDGTLHVWRVGGDMDMPEIASLEPSVLRSERLAEWRPGSSRELATVEGGVGSLSFARWDALAQGLSEVATVHHDHVRDVQCIAWRPQGDVLAAHTQKGALSLWRWDAEAQSWREAALVDDNVEGAASGVTWHHDGRWLVTNGQDGGISVWSWDGTALHMVHNGHMSIEGSTSSVAPVQWSPCGRWITVADLGCEATLWTASLELQGPRRAQAMSEATRELSPAMSGPAGAASEGDGGESGDKPSRPQGLASPWLESAHVSEYTQSVMLARVPELAESKHVYAQLMRHLAQVQTQRAQPVLGALIQRHRRDVELPAYVKQAAASIGSATMAVGTDGFTALMDAMLIANEPVVRALAPWLTDLAPPEQHPAVRDMLRCLEQAWMDPCSGQVLDGWLLTSLGKHNVVLDGAVTVVQQDQQAWPSIETIVAPDRTAAATTAEQVSGGQLQRGSSGWVDDDGAESTTASGQRTCALRCLCCGRRAVQPEDDMSGDTEEEGEEGESDLTAAGMSLADVEVAADVYVLCGKGTSRGSDGDGTQRTLTTSLLHVALRRGYVLEFESVALQALIKQKWEAFGRGRMLRVAVYYLLLLMCFLAVTTLRSDATHSWRAVLSTDAEEGLVWTALGLFCVGWLWFAQKEVQQARRDGAAYLRSGWNVLDVGSLFLLVTAAVMSAAATPEWHVVSAVAALGGWTKMLYFLRAFTGTGALVRLVIDVVVDLRFFLVVMGVIVVGFANSLFLLLQPSLVGWPEMSEDVESLEVSYATPLASLGTAYRMLLGDWDMDMLGSLTGLESALTWMLFVLFTFIVVIVLLNLLIAILSDSYEQARDRALQAMMFERAELLVELERGMSDADVADRWWFPDWIVLAVPEGSVTDHTKLHAGSEWQGRMKAIQAALRGSERRVSDKIDEQRAIMDRRFAALERSVASLPDEILDALKRTKKR